MGKVLAGGYRINKMTRFVVSLLAAMVLAFAAGAQDWGQMKTPTQGPPQSIGFYTAGCLQGAQALPLDGPGYEAIRISRNRYWGQPVTIDFVMRFSEQVRAADDGIDDTVFTDQHVALLRLAATSPGVDRIFANKWIKQRLCQTVTGNRSWLNKIVVWVGHDEHFHVRMHCPPGNPQCQAQAGYYADDGCGEQLDVWFTKPPVRLPPPGTPQPPYRPKLPAACQAVLNAP